MNEIRQIKKLQSQLNTMIADAEVLKIEVANKQREYDLKNRAIKKMKAEIQKANTQTPKVSEHAIVRYFERVRGFNIEEIEKEILSEKVLSFIEQLGGNGEYPNEGFSVLMKNFTVTTIIKS